MRRSREQFSKERTLVTVVNHSNAILRTLTLAVIWLMVMGVGLAQTDVKWAARTEGKTLIVTGELPGKYHVYSTVPVPPPGPFPTTIKPAAGEKIILGKTVAEPGIETKMDPGFGKDVKMFGGTARFEVPIESAPAGNAKVDITFQLCDDKGCLPPKKETLTVTVSEAVAGGAGSASTPPAIKTPVKPVQTEGLFSFFLIALTAGFVSLLTPCVFPMIPITVSVFTKNGSGGVKKALAFCGGIIGTFVGLGVLVSVIAGASGLQNLANNPWLNLGLALLFIFLSLSLFGVFEITLPGTLANKVSTDGKGQYIGPILMGLVFSLTSFTCTMPFVGTLLVSAAQGNLLYPIVGMLGFSSAFSVPFFALAMFPQMVSKLPRSGSWLSVVKAAMGFLELAAALKFLSNVDLGWSLGWLTQPVFLSIWASLMLMAGLFLLRAIKLPSVDDDGKVGVFRIATGIGSIVLAGFFLAAINGTGLGKLASFLPPNPYPTMIGKAQVSGDGEIPDYDQALTAAKESNKPLLIDFTGIYCTNCRDMELNVFPHVKKEFAQFERAKLYTDRIDSESDQKHQKIKEQMTGSVANPQYAILTPDGKVVSTMPYTDNVEDFRKFLTEGFAKASQ